MITLTLALSLREREANAQAVAGEGIQSTQLSQIALILFLSHKVRGNQYPTVRTEPVEVRMTDAFS